MTDYPEAVLRYARQYARRKIPVFPVVVTPDGVKYPAIKGGHGHLDATCDLEVIEEWFGPEGKYRGCGLGGYLAKADPPMAAIDIDVKNGGAGPEQYQALQEQHGAIADTVRVLTPTGGWHDWVQMNGSRIGSTNGGLPNSPDIDIKGVGGWVVLPPTQLADGRAYVFEEGHRPSVIATAIDPGWIAQLCPTRIEGEGGGRWRELERDRLHELDRRALEALERLGGHSPFIGGDGCVHITRPGKAAGTSASVGYLGPGIVGLRTPNWKGLPGGSDLRVYELDELEQLTKIATNVTGRLEAERASAIAPKRVHWIWQERLAVGTLALLAGPEGLGKSTLAFTIAAMITRGELPGEHFGFPKAVLISATEDSWAHTIVPRLMAADANLDLAYKVEARAAEDIMVGLSLPDDLAGLEGLAAQTGAALLILDPLMSRLHASLDTHKDGDVRRALEPIKSVAENTSMAIWGLIHHNKSGSSDPLQLVMASKAFTAVARSVHTVIRDPDDETGQRRYFGTPKNNLGRTDLSTLTFTIEPYTYPTDEGDGVTGQLCFGQDSDETISDLLARANQDPELRTALDEASTWLDEYLTASGPRVSSADAKKAGAGAGHSVRSIERARKRLKLDVESVGFPRVTYWVRSAATVAPSQNRGATGATGATQGLSGAKNNSPAIGQSPQEAGATDSADDSTEWAQAACVFEAGSLWCIRDPCPNPHHRGRSA